jgi:hypothetical protein
MKKIHPNDDGFELNANVRKEVKDADKRNIELHKNVINYWFSESKTYQNNKGFSKIKDWFALILIEFFSIYKNEWMLDVASEQKRNKKKFEFDNLFKVTFPKSKIEKDDILWFKEKFIGFFESNRTEDNEIFWNYGTSAFASTLLTAKCYADKGAIENFENTTIVLDTNILMVLELEGYEYNAALKNIGKAFKKMNSKPIYFNISKEEYARALNPKRSSTLNALERYGYDIVSESDCDFMRTAIKRGCVSSEEFDTFFREISDVPETFCDEVDLTLMDNKELLNIFEKCEEDTKMSSELDSISYKRTKHNKRDVPRKHDLGLLKSAEHLRNEGDKCIILTRDGTIREYANSKILRDEMPIAIGLDSLIQLLAIENGGLDHDSTEFTSLFNKIVKSSFSPSKESYQVEDLQFMIQSQIKIEELDIQRKISIAKKVNQLRFNGHSDGDIILEIQREFQGGIKDIKKEYETLKAQKSSLDGKNIKINTEHNNFENSLRKTNYGTLRRKIIWKIGFNWFLLFFIPTLGVIVGYLLSQKEESSPVLNYSVSIFVGVVVSSIMLLFKVKLFFRQNDKDKINEQVDLIIERIRKQN